jgi:protein Mpv17
LFFQGNRFSVISISLTVIRPIHLYQTSDDTNLSSILLQPAMFTIRVSILILVSSVLACNAFATSTALQKAEINNKRRWNNLPRVVNSPVLLATDLKKCSDTVNSTKQYAKLANIIPMPMRGTQIRNRSRILYSCTGALLLFSVYSTRRNILGTSALESLGLLSEKLLHSYKHSMVMHPLLTKVATGASLAVLGDAEAQRRESDGYDLRRAVSFAAFDSCYRMFQHAAFPTIVGVCTGKFLGGILSALPSLTLGTNFNLFLAAMERTLMYQLGVIPLFYYPVFFTFTGFIQGLTLKETFQRAKLNFLPCWKRNLMFWVPIQLIMFGLIDEQWQIPFVCVMGMIWSTILSVTAGRATGPKQTSK